jgi:uncharacterized membrane protein YqiK
MGTDSIVVIGVVAVAVLAGIITMGLIVSRLYRRATKETSFVRTGFGGQKVIMNGGALVLPVLHDVIWVNMNTLRLEVLRSREQALITKDRMRVDVQAEFYVRVKPTTEASRTRRRRWARKPSSRSNSKSWWKVSSSMPCAPSPPK